MDIQAIRNLVAKKIAGQDTMVDVGGGLPVILNAIFDAIEEGGGGGSEPLIVVGMIDEDRDFIPNEGQPSHEDAVEAFRNGTLVLIDVVDEDSDTHILYHVTKFDFDSNELTAGSVSW